MLMTACDLGAVTRPWKISKQVAELVTSEFFEQGDRERSELKLTPAAIFDRNRKDELPALQLEWIDGICKPLYQALLKLNRKLQPMIDGIDANRNKWQDLCSSYQQTRRASISNQSADSDQSPEPLEDAETSQHSDSGETLKPTEIIKFGAKCSHDVRSRVNDKPATAGNAASARKN
uniref:Dual 3',5'-cyclic-AMP and -GMP phosphodiesterase 11A-like n=1 Tax=Sparus aurata TaxID=8175 RepID=A0A671US22_SPAAU